MAVPGYQEFMLPLLKLTADGSEHPIREAMDTLAAQLGISAQDRQIMLPSGTQTRYYNRVTWATTYLTKSGLLEKTGRGRIRITPRGPHRSGAEPAADRQRIPGSSRSTGRSRRSTWIAYPQRPTRAARSRRCVKPM